MSSHPPLTTVATAYGAGTATTKHTTITPSSSKIETTSTNKASSGGNVAIPIVAGLAAAAAAGVGAKIYLDKKNEDEDDATAEEWEGDFETEDQVEEQVLDNSDDFGYQAQTATDNIALDTSNDSGNGYQAISFDDISETH